jgi:hypothetical protein
MDALRRVLVTGATGTLGYNIAVQLASKYPQTRINLLLRRLDQDLFSAFPNVSQQKADLKNIDLFKEAVLDFQPDAIIHCAATGVRPSNVDYRHHFQFDCPNFQSLLLTPELSFCAREHGAGVRRQRTPLSRRRSHPHPTSLWVQQGRCRLFASGWCGSYEKASDGRAAILFHRIA